MLEKVVNISPGTDYRKSSGNPKYYKKLGPHGYQKIHSNDYLSISPATSLLASLGWKLKKLNKHSEKLHLVFEIDGFEFETAVLPNELNHNPAVDYKVEKNFHGHLTEIFVSVSLKAPIGNKFVPGSKKKLETLFNFFEQFNAPGITKPNTITNKLTIDSFLSDYKKLLKEEFEYINACLIQFIEKYFSVEVNFYNTGREEGEVVVKSIEIR
ncbi:MAG: hypothetical protein HYS25_08445 [Ignavibacteriales bacterium]|nr:hypothetical protein [Ignavibacteriales bacterium]